MALRCLCPGDLSPLRPDQRRRACLRVMCSGRRRCVGGCGPPGAGVTAASCWGVPVGMAGGHTLVNSCGLAGRIPTVFVWGIIVYQCVVISNNFTWAIISSSWSCDGMSIISIEPSFEGMQPLCLSGWRYPTIGWDSHASMVQGCSLAWSQPWLLTFRVRWGVLIDPTVWSYQLWW